MPDRCDHCGREFADGERVNQTDDGTFCIGTCWFDAVVLDVGPDEIAPRRGRVGR